MNKTEEISLISEADECARNYLKSIEDRRVFPDQAALLNLDQLGGKLSNDGSDSFETLNLLASVGEAATVTSNGPNYYGFVIGATLPVAAAADRLAAAWDQCASSHVNSPAMAKIEKVAGDWLLDVLGLPIESGVGFGTSATACGMSCLATARAGLLQAQGWDVAEQGLAGAPIIRVVVPETVHVTVKKALKLLGFGMSNVEYATVDDQGRVVPEKLPPLDAQTILCLQAGEVNTGEFDRFDQIIPAAKRAGAWVHVDGAFGLWARASRQKRSLTEGVELADSWTTDGHKWLNTPYESAVAICRNKSLLAKTLNADAVYSTAEDDAQKNITLEFSRKAKGLGFWAVLRTLGRDGVEKLVDQYCDHAMEIAAGVKELGITVHNRVVLNQVLCSLETDEKTREFLDAVQRSGEVWFGPSVWEGRPVFRISVSSWRTQSHHVRKLLSVIDRHL